METKDIDAKDMALGLVDAAASITRKLNGGLSMIKGISFSEYQLLAALQERPKSTATRVDLAAAVGLTPSGVTRALKPLEKIGYVETIKDGRDARKSLAALTKEGEELVSDANGVVNDTLEQLSAFDSMSGRSRQQLVALCSELAA